MCTIQGNLHFYSSAVTVHIVCGVIFPCTHGQHVNVRYFHQEYAQAHYLNNPPRLF